jgi:gamma-glutamyltranspeptidase/glutathione hydrolase
MTRRRFVELGSAGWLLSQASLGLTADEPSGVAGLIVGQAEGAEAGQRVLADGGNAVDAAVAGTLVAAVVSISNCGIGGYGGHLVVGWPDGKVAAIDFNSTAPAAARADMFPLDTRGHVRGGVNDTGWLAAGVPGTLAGLVNIKRCFQGQMDRFWLSQVSQNARSRKSNAPTRHSVKA